MDKTITQDILLADLRAHERNYNYHSDAQIARIAKSLETFGQVRSIVVRNNTILAGHGVVLAARSLGWQTIRADVQDQLTEAQALAYVVADNELARQSDPDQAQLAAILEELQAKEPLLVEAAGYSAQELEQLLRLVNPKPVVDSEAQVDRAEELRVKWGTATGQLWALGDDHRLICGDCTDAAVVARVMDGERAEMVWTDPPYGVKYGDKLDAANPISHRVRSIQNDDLPPDKLEEFIRSAFRNAADHTIAGAALYAACPAGTPLPTAIAAFVGSGFEFRWQLVWVKDSLVLSRADYHFRHENILYGWKPDGAHWFADDRTQDSVFEIPRPKVSEEHPTMKPVGLVAEMLLNSSKPKAIIYEPFAGSGTTGIACHNLGRRARMVEISEAYTAVILERFAQIGVQPVLLEAPVLEAA